MIGLISIKYLQSTKFRVKCYKCYETTWKNCDDYPSVRIPKPKQLNVFNILILSKLELLLLYFFNHILVFFVALFEFSLNFLTSVYRVTVNHFRMGGGQFYRSFIIRVLDYLLYYNKKIFTVLFVNIFIKLFYIIGIFTHFSISICINFPCKVFRIFYYFMFGCLFSLVYALLLSVFVNVLHVYLFASFNDYDASSGSISFFHIHTSIDKDVDCLQSNNNSSSKNLWLLFSASFLFLKIWFSKSGNITLRLYVFLIVYLLLFLQKHIKNSDHQETIRCCSRYEFFTSEFIDTCEDIQSLITQLTINHYSISKLKYQNLNSFSHLLLLLSGDASLNPGPVHQDTLQCLNEWNVFKNRGLNFIYLNINSLLPKIDELRYIAKSTNAAVIGICESKLDASVLEKEISINYKILRCDRNRQGGGVACYVRNDLSYNTLSVFPREVENIFFEILLPNSKCLFEHLLVLTIYLDVF